MYETRYLIGFTFLVMGSLGVLGAKYLRGRYKGLHNALMACLPVALLALLYWPLDLFNRPPIANQRMTDSDIKFSIQFDRWTTQDESYPASAELGHAFRKTQIVGPVSQKIPAVSVDYAQWEIFASMGKWRRY